MRNESDYSSKSNFSFDLISSEIKASIKGIICLLILSTFSVMPRAISQDVPNDTDCLVCASVFTYPQLASLTSNNGELSQLLLGQLLGSEINLTALNYQGLIQENFSLIEFLTELSGSVGLSSPNEVLQADVTILKILEALATVASNQGTIAALNELIALNLNSGTVMLSNLMTLNTINGDLVDINLDFFTFIVGAVQLYNYENVAVTNSPVQATIPLLGEVTIQAQVVEPPHFGCASSGMSFFSAGVRLKLDIDITNTVFFNTTVNLAPLVNADVEATIGQIGLYLDIARGEFLMNQVHYPNQTISYTVTPGLARAFVGEIDINDFLIEFKIPC